MSDVILNILNRVHNGLGMIRGRFFAPANPLRRQRYPSEQTETSWAKPVKSFDTVPEIYKDYFAPFLNDGQEFPYSVLTPAYDGYIHKTTEKLVCDFGHAIHILENKGNAFEVQCYPLEGISCVEVKMFLLDSSIKICGVTVDGVPGNSTFRFNSVTDYLFSPILQRVRHAIGDFIRSGHSDELEKFDAWSRINFKFMNYARRSLLLGEKVKHIILQPEIRETALRIFGKTYQRIISPTLASILTDRELIMIREKRRRSGEDKYGGIWDYMPLNKISSLSFKEKDKNLLTLTIQLFEGTQLEFLFQDSAKDEICRLQDQFQELRIA